MKKVSIIILTVLLMASLLVGWKNARNAPKIQEISNVGSTALQPLTEAVANSYQKQNKNVNLMVQGGGSGTGLSQVQGNAVDIGSSDIYAEQSSGIKSAKLSDHIVAVSGFVPVVNPELKVENLSRKQLQQIFLGKIRNWQEVGGPDLPITVINRASGSGTRVSFEQTILGNGKSAINAQEQDSNGTVKEIVANNPGAISYIAFAYVNNRVKTLKIDGVSPTPQNVTTNRWPLWSYEHMYTTKNPDSSTTSFIKYMQSEHVQSTIVKNAHYISIHEMKVTKSPDGKVSAIDE